VETDISLHRGSIGEPGGGSSFVGNSEIQMMGCGNGAYFCMGGLLGEPGDGAALLATLKDVERKALEMGSSLCRGPVGERVGDSLAATLERKG